MVYSKVDSCKNAI
jgi:hypothetical protein